MATTEQRSGFRLPWASDARPGAPANAQTPPDPDPQPDAEGVTTADPTTAEANTMQDVEIPDSRPITWPGAEPNAELPADDAASTEASSPSAAGATDGPPARDARTSS